MREGEIVALGTPARARESAPPETEIRYRRDGREVVVESAGADEDAARAHGRGARRRASSSRGCDVRQPSLEDVYLELTGGDQE